MSNFNMQDLKNRMATTQVAQTIKPTESVEQPKERTDSEEESKARVFHGQFDTYQQYLTNSGKVVSFYKGYCVTEDPETAEYCAKLPQVKELTGKANLEDIPVAPKRQRNRNWASAQSAQPHVFSPADLLQRVVVANTSNSVPAAQSTSTN